MAPAAAIACFGAAHIDRHARAVTPVVLGSSNPVRVSLSLGGVARNVAESLARLDCPVALVSRLGPDGDGDRVLDFMTGLGVAMDGTERSSTAPTAGYTALVGPEGDLAVGMADMAIYDELTPLILGQALKGLDRHMLWFADCNLPAETLTFLRQAKPSAAMLAVDAVSVAKSERLGSELHGIDILFCNRDEAAALAGETKPEAEMADAIRERGAGSVIVSLGADGVVLTEASGPTFLQAPDVAVRDVTGAGDALVAGTLFGLANDRALAESVRLGLAAAALSLEGERAVNNTLSAEALLSRAGLTA